MLNRLMETMKMPVPEVGMGVTETRWSDRVAYTVVEILNARTIVVQADKVTRTDGHGMSESQTYVYERDANGTKRVLTLRLDGKFREKGSGKGSSGWLFGERRAYHDYSF